jgi:hypothetical protein
MRELCDCDNCITECTDRPNCQILARINRHNDTVTIPRAEYEALQTVLYAAENLRSVKGRHHTEIACQKLYAAIAASKDTRANLDQGKGESEDVSHP